MAIKWRRYAEALPTAADADANGYVLTRAGTGGFYCSAKWHESHSSPWNEWTGLNEEPAAAQINLPYMGSFPLWPHQKAREPQPYANTIAALWEDFRSYYRYVPDDPMYFEFLVRVIRAVIEDDRKVEDRLQRALRS